MVGLKLNHVYMARDYLSMLGLKLNHVSKRGYWNQLGVLALKICYKLQHINIHFILDIMHTFAQNFQNLAIPGQASSLHLSIKLNLNMQCWHYTPITQPLLNGCDIWHFTDISQIYISLNVCYFTSRYQIYQSLRFICLLVQIIDISVPGITLFASSNYCLEIVWHCMFRNNKPYHDFRTYMRLISSQKSLHIAIMEQMKQILITSTMKLNQITYF